MNVNITAPENVDRSLDSQRANLLALEKNWDGYGALPLRAELVDDVIETVRRGGGNVLVDIVPGSDGSIQAEWHLPGYDVEFLIDPNGEKTLYVWSTEGE